MANYPIVWVNEKDGITVEVWPDYKRRIMFGHPSNRYPMGDEWPILKRSDVPTLTDEEWEAKPISGDWKQKEPTS